MATRTTIRDERKRAKAAIAHAKTAEKEAKQLAKELPKGATRSRVQLLVAETHALRRAAQADRKRAPARAAKSAERVTAVLDSTAMRLVPGADRIRAREGKQARADAATNAKRRSKLVKRRRKQAKKIQGWAKSIAARTVVQSVTTPTDAEAAKSDRTRIRRARREDRRGGPGR